MVKMQYLRSVKMVAFIIYRDLNRMTAYGQSYDPNINNQLFRGRNMNLPTTKPTIISPPQHLLVYQVDT